MATLAGFSGASIVPRHVQTQAPLSTLAQGAQVGQGLSQQFLTPGLLEKIAAGDQGAVTQLAGFNPEAVTNFQLIQQNQRVGQQAQVIQGITNERIELIQQRADIGVLIKGGEEGLSNSIARMMKDNPDMSVEDKQELVDLFNMPVSEGFLKLQDRLVEVNAKITASDQILTPVGQQLGSAEQRSFEALIAGLSPDDAESARRIKLGLDARAVGSADITTAEKGNVDLIAEIKRILAGGKRTGTLETDIRLGPKLSDLEIAEQKRIRENTAAIDLQLAKDKAQLELETAPGIAAQIITEEVEAREKTATGGIDLTNKQLEQAAANRTLFNTNSTFVSESAATRDNIRGLLDGNNLSKIFGAVSGRTPTVGQEATDLEARLDQVRGQIIIEARKKLKGQGTITDGEQVVLERAATIISNQSISPELARKELRRIDTILARNGKKAQKILGTLPESAGDRGVIMVDPVTKTRALVFKDGSYVELN